MEPELQFLQKKMHIEIQGTARYNDFNGGAPCECRKPIWIQALSAIWINPQYALLDKTDEIYALADRIIQRKILPRKSIEDARHIAHALIVERDYEIT
ncbi:MAG: hypothetical protein LBP30_04385 [Clostridiales Family XIII bacterium]|nr:hypothetical protein [Clostridiales Family XIII bacterium]